MRRTIDLTLPLEPPAVIAVCPGDYARHAGQLYRVMGIARSPDGPIAMLSKRSKWRALLSVLEWPCAPPIWNL